MRGTKNVAVPAAKKKYDGYKNTHRSEHRRTKRR